MCGTRVLGRQFKGCWDLVSLNCSAEKPVAQGKSLVEHFVALNGEVIDEPHHVFEDLLERTLDKPNPARVDLDSQRKPGVELDTKVRAQNFLPSRISFADWLAGFADS